MRGRTVASLVLAAVVVGPWSSEAAALDEHGQPGPSFAGAYLEPSGSKPQSKLWHHAGYWFGILWHSPSATFRIHRLDRPTSAWVDTGTVVDTRMNSRSDATMVGGRLYVASHRYSKTAETGNYPSRLLRFSYDAAGARWTLDSGFPTVINNVKTEALVADVDSRSRVWAAWTYGNRVWVNRTIGDDRTWGAPFALPTSTAIRSDDIASIVAFGSRVGVLWSDQEAGVFWFSVHDDGASDETWSPPERVLGGEGMSDDHLSVKAASDGRLFAVLKTGRMGDDDPLIVLAVRAPGGAWSTSTVATERYSHTRPIVVLDEAAGRVHVMLTGPQPPNISGQKGGDIYLKSADLDAPVFEDGYGTVVMRSASASDLNNVTSTKQISPDPTGLVAVATSQALERYWSATIATGASTAPPSPSFAASDTTIEVGESVSFVDTSTGQPTEWLWSFGDGATSTEQSPSHVYTEPGSFSVTLDARNAGGASRATAVIEVVPPAGSTVPVRAAEDAYVSSASPTTNAGTSSFLRVGTGSATYRSYIRFVVPEGTTEADRVVLRLAGASNTGTGGSVHVAGADWTENGVTWANAPAIGDHVAEVGRVTNGAWVEIDVTHVVRSPGTYTFVLAGGGTSSAWFSSRQGANPPELLITLR